MADQEFEISLRDLLSIFRRRFRVIGLTVLLVLGAALVYVLAATPMYRAESLILVDPQEQNLLDPTQSIVASGAALNARVDSEVEILRSNDTALAVVDAANLVADEEFGPRQSTIDRLLQAVGFENSSEEDGAVLVNNVLTRLTNARDVRRKGLTYTIGLGVTSESPERAALLANTFAETYITQQIASKRQSFLSSRDAIGSQIAAAEIALAQSEERLDGFIFDNIDRLEAESGEEAVAQLRADLAALQAERRTQLTSSSEVASAFEARDWAALSDSLEDRALAALNSQREELERRLSGAGQDSSLAIDLRAALERTEAELEARAEQQLGVLRAEVESFDSQISDTRDTIRETLLRADLPATTLAQVFTLQQEAELTRRQYQNLLSRLSDLDAQSAVQIADSRLVSRALPPANASFPNKKLILALALVVAIGLGMSLALASEYYLGGIISTEQLSNVSQMPSAGSVPATLDDQTENSVADLVVSQPLSAYAEAFRKLRGAVDLSEIKRQRTDEKFVATVSPKGLVILVTSAVPAEGKTTTSLALARTYAQSGKSTVLIDADLRKPSLAGNLGLTSSTSLKEFLANPKENSDDWSFVSQDPMSSLQVVLGSSKASEPTDQLLNSESFKLLIREAKSKAEIIIIDTPPLLPLVDTRYIAAHADVIMMVARFGATSQSEVREAANLLKASAGKNASFFSVLSHHQQPKKNNKYGDYYHSYTT